MYLSQMIAGPTCISLPRVMGPKCLFSLITAFTFIFLLHVYTLKIITELFILNKRYFPFFFFFFMIIYIVYNLT